MIVRDIERSDKQKKAWLALEDPEILELVYGGGGRSGKTFLGALYYLTKCMEYEGSAWLVGRESLKKLKRTTIVTFFKAMRYLGMEKGVDWKYNAAESILYVANAEGSFEEGLCSVIFFEELSLQPSDPLFDRLGSYDLTGGWIDEAQEVVKQAKDTLQTRYSVLTGVNCDGSVWETTGGTLCTCNPKKNWIYSDFVKPQEDGTIDPSKKFIPALFSDNPFIDQKKYEAGIRSTNNKILIARLLLGDFNYDDSPNQIMDLDRINDLFSNTFIEPDGMRYMTADIALQGADKFTIGIWHGYVLERVYMIDKCSAPEVEKRLKREAMDNNVPRSCICYDGDGVGSFLDGYLQGAISFRNNAPALNGENYQSLKSQCAFKLARVVNDNGIYIRDDRYKEEIIEELEQIRQTKVDDEGKLAIESKKEVKKRLNRSPDLSDMILMRMYFDIFPERSTNDSGETTENETTAVREQVF